MANSPLIFIDTNIWLDFYRARTGAGLTLLRHVDKILDQIIVTYQVEMEFKKNRQKVILSTIKELEPLKPIQGPGILSDAKAVQALKKNRDIANALVKRMKARLESFFEDPGKCDPVYKICQRVFRRTDRLHLRRDNNDRRAIRRKAFKRFLLGYPPRKDGDTSIGDAMNWEWLIHCAEHIKSDVIIVSRDSDYGTTHGDKVYLNDHLKQEFKERVSNRSKIVLCMKLSEGLKAFQVPVTRQEKEEEDRLVETSIAPRGWQLPSPGRQSPSMTDLPSLADIAREWAKVNVPTSLQSSIAEAIFKTNVRESK